jgi:hypothetical protein
MEVLILFTLLIFMALFISGGILVIKGLLAKKSKQWITGIALLVLCLIFMYLIKLAPGAY